MQLVLISSPANCRAEMSRMAAERLLTLAGYMQPNDLSRLPYSNSHLGHFHDVHAELAFLGQKFDS